MTQRVIYIFFIINVKASNIIITAQVSDMAHGSLVILKILGFTKSNTESKLKHHINAGFLKILLVYGITSEKFHFNITCIFHVNN